MEIFIFNMEKGLVSVVLIVRNRKEDLIKCINSIKNNTYKKVEIIVADNNSTDGSKEAVKKLFPDVILLEHKLNIGSTIAMNDCIKKSKGEFILRLDNDVIMGEDSIEKMVEVLKSDKKIGATSCLYFYTEKPNILRGTDIRINLFTGKTTIRNRNKKYNGEFEGKLLESFSASGCTILSRRSIYDEIGFYDENYFLAYEDVDWCLRLRRAGYKIIIVGSAKIYHSKEGGMAEKYHPFRVYLTNHDQILFMKKHAGGRNLIFIPYLCLFLYPAKIFIYLIKKQFECVKMYTRAVFTGLLDKGAFIYDENEKKILYHK